MLKDFSGITLLNNEICIVTNENPDITVSFDDFNIKNVEEDLVNVLSRSEYVIYGGTGFAGNNDKFNANDGIYRNLIINRSIEKKLSSKHSYMLNKLLQLYEDKCLICLTHMAPQEWYDFQTNSTNCIFVSGHSHRNIYEENKYGKFYLDNQIGYDNNSYFTKGFLVNINININYDYQDGIIPIKPIEYYFLTGERHSLSKLFDDQLFLLCKDGVKMFISKNKHGVLHILNGGVKTKLEYKDINYYYDNLTSMAQSLCNSFDGFNKYINKISKIVEELGGSGYVHGCIVDIDLLFNKIFVNPFDGTVTPYTAPELYSGKRTIYRSIRQLLEETPCKTEEIINMNSNYLTSKSKYSVIEITRKAPKRIHTYSTEKSFVMAYKVSKKMKKIQSIFDNNILKDWDESFIVEHIDKPLLK